MFYAAMRVKSVGTAKIGGNWTLVTHEGRPATSANLLGRYSLIYFGFTYCPDICPYELRKMTQVVNTIGTVENFDFAKNVLHLTC
jgi:protein SCO1